jgi:hypothetical protein
MSKIQTRLMFSLNILCLAGAVLGSCGERKADETSTAQSGAAGNSGSSTVENAEYVTSEIGERVPASPPRPFPKIAVSSGAVPLPQAAPTPWEPAEAFSSVEKNCNYCHNDFRYKEVLLSVREKAIQAIEDPLAPKKMPPFNSRPFDYRNFKDSADGQALLLFLKSTSK